MNRFAPSPEKKDENTHWKERLLVQSVVFTIVFVIVNMIFMFIVQRENYYFSVDFALLGFQFGFLWLARKGYYKPVAVALIVTLWGFLTVGIGDYTSVTEPLFNLYIFVVLLAGLLLNTRAAAITTIATVFAGLYSYALDPSPVAQQMLLYITVLMMVSVYLLYRTNGEIELGFTQAREKQTELEAANAHLKESEARYRNLIDFSSVCMVVNSMDGIIQYANPYAHQVFGATRENQLVGRSSWDHFPEETLKLMANRMKLIEDRDQTPLVECKLLTLDKRLIDVEVNSLPIQYEGKTAILGIINDVTERNQAHAVRMEAERLRIELENERQFGKLRDEFITMMSHEFRTPLSVIHSSKDLLERYNERLSQEKRALHFKKIGTQVSNMVDMLDGMLTLSQANAGMLPFVPRKSDLTQICREIFERTQELDAGERTLRFSAEAPMIETIFDEKMMRTVIMSLLTDARHHTPVGGHIHLSIARQETNNQAIITVSDDGHAITEEAQKHLFQPFFYHDDPNAGRGTGLDLAIVHEYVGAHGGTVTCDNRENGGITYTILLPIKKPIGSPELHPA